MNRDSRFVDFAFPHYSIECELEVFGKESVGTESLGLAVIMIFITQMKIFH